MKNDEKGSFFIIFHRLSGPRGPYFKNPFKLTFKTDIKFKSAPFSKASTDTKTMKKWWKSDILVIFDCVRDTCGLEFYVQFKGPLLWIFKIEARVTPQNTTNTSKMMKSDQKSRFLIIFDRFWGPPFWDPLKKFKSYDG